MLSVEGFRRISPSVWERSRSPLLMGHRVGHVGRTFDSWTSKATHVGSNCRYWAVAVEQGRESVSITASGTVRAGADTGGRRIGLDATLFRRRTNESHSPAPAGRAQYLSMGSSTPWRTRTRSPGRTSPGPVRGTPRTGSAAAPGSTLRNLLLAARRPAQRTAVLLYLVDQEGQHYERREHRRHGQGSRSSFAAQPPELPTKSIQMVHEVYI